MIIIDRSQKWRDARGGPSSSIRRSVAVGSRQVSGGASASFDQSRCDCANMDYDAFDFSVKDIACRMTIYESLGFFLILFDG